MACVVLLPYILLLDPGLLGLLTRLAALLRRDSVLVWACVRVLISAAIGGWLAGLGLGPCCDSPMLSAGDRCD